MRINENTDVNAFYLFPTKYGLKLASITFCLDYIFVVVSTKTAHKQCDKHFLFSDFVALFVAN